MNAYGYREAAGVFLVHQGKVLVVSRKYDGTLFGLPCGKVEKGETPKQAAARECWEETTIVVSGLKPLYEGIGSNNFYLYIFFTTQFEGMPVSTGEGEVAWIEPERLPLGAFPESSRKILDAWRQLKAQAS
jgi:8-oxo-dGTP diphosphatase